MHVHSVSKQFFYGEDKKVKVNTKSGFVLGVGLFWVGLVGEAFAGVGDLRVALGGHPVLPT